MTIENILWSMCTKECCRTSWYQICDLQIMSYVQWATKANTACYNATFCAFRDLTKIPINVIDVTEILMNLIALTAILINLTDLTEILLNLINWNFICWTSTIVLLIRMLLPVIMHAVKTPTFLAYHRHWWYYLCNNRRRDLINSK